MSKELARHLANKMMVERHNQQVKEYWKQQEAKKIVEDTAKANETRKQLGVFDRAMNPGLSQQELIQGIERNQAQKAEQEAKQRYEAYSRSEAGRKEAQEAQRLQNQLAFASGGSINFPVGVPAQGEKAKEYEAVANYYEQKRKATEDRHMMEKDVAEVEAMSAEDRRLLETYAYGRNEWFDHQRIADSVFARAELEKKYGKQKVEELAESWQRYQNAVSAEKNRQQTQEGAGSGFFAGVGHSAASVAANALGTLTAPFGYLQEAFGRTGRYQTLDPNNPGAMPGQYASAVREGVTEDMGTAGKVLYQGTMGALDNLARIAMGGGTAAGSLGLAAMGSFGSTLSEASAQGATPAQAVGKAVLSAGIEVATEKIGLDELFAAGKGGYKGAAAAFRQALKQGGIEAAEEEIALLANVLVDALVMQEKSDYSQQIGKLVANGMSYQEAKNQADRQLWDEAVNTAFTSWISGGVMSGAQSGAQYVGQQVQERGQMRSELASQIRGMMDRENAENATQNAVVAENATAETPKTVTDEQIREAMNELYPREKTGEERMAELEAEMDRMIDGNELTTKEGQDRYQVLAQEWNELRNQEDAEVAGRADSLATEEAPPERIMAESTGGNERIFGNPLAGRTEESVGRRSVKAYQYENPEVKPYFQDAARGILSDINNSMPGQRIFNEDLHYQSGGEKGWIGNKRITTDDLAEIKDAYGYTWDELREAAEDIIHDRGRENNAASKRLEFLIHNRLANGYTDVEGRPMPANREYLDFLEERQINEYRREGLGDLIANADRYAPQGAGEGFEAMGAASKGFTGKEAYNELLTDENVQPVRPWAVREMEVPKADKDGKRVTEFAANAAGAAATSDAVADSLAQLIGEGAMSFDSRSKQQSINNAVSELEKRPISEVVREISERVSQGTIKDGDIEKALVAYNLLSNDGSPDGQARAAAMLPMLGKMANISGRNLNMFGILKKLDPNMQVQAVQDDINRTVKEMNKERKATKQIGQQEGKQISDASRKAKTDVTGKIRSNAGKIRVDGGKVKASNQAGQPFIFEYAERVGQELAKAMIPKVSRERTTMERITSQLRRWAAEKAPTKERAKHLTAVDLLRDYIQNQDFYNRAWENAQMQLAEHAKGRLQGIRDLGDLVFSGVGEELANIAGIITSGIGVDGTADARNKIFLKAITEAAVDAGETKRTMANKSALGVTDAQIAEKIAGNLIEKTGAEGEMADTIREAVRNYVKKITDEADMDKLLENQIKAAMVDIGETLTQAAKKSTGHRKSIQKQITNLLVEKHGLSAEDAEKVAKTVGEQFGKMVKQRAEEILKSRFAERKGKNERTIMEVFEEYVNLGAFDIGSDFNEASARKLFGDQAVKINEELAEMFKKAKTEEEKAKVLDDIYKDIASRIKPTVWEMWDAWRNLAMLGNFKTQIRNFLGSGAFRPSVNAKRAVGAALERAFVDQENRTKALIGTSAQDKALLEWAKQDAKSENIQKMMQYSGTTGNEVRSAIEEQRRYLPGKLEDVRRFNMEKMEQADMAWKKREYALALAGFLKARGYTAKQAAMDIMTPGGVPTEVMDEARSYAAKEAMKATFNDRNRFSDRIAKLRVKGNKPLDRATNIVLKGVLPFTRTPANVLVRAVEYSPAGLAEGFRQLAQDVKTGDATVADGLDKIASGLTGTGAMVLGAALAYGLIPNVKLIGRLDEDDKEEDPNAIEYSLKIGDKYYGISWLAPGAIPLLIGANFYQSIQDKEEIADGWDVLSAMGGTVADTLDPLLELSMLSSFNDMVETVRYEDSPGEMALAAVTNAATNYFTQGLPTLFGQIEQATEKTKSSVYSNADNPMQRSFERTVGRATQRIPVVDLYQTERLDAEGNPVENGPWYQRAFDALINPFTHSESGTTPITKELSRLDVTAPTVSKTVTYTDDQGNKREDYRLSAEEFSAMQRIQLGNSNRIMSEMLENSDYEKLPDDLKEKALEYAKDYARELARGEVLPGYDGMDSWMQGIEGNEAGAIIQKVAAAEMTDAFSAITTAWREGYESDSGPLEELEQAVQVYDTLSADMQKTVLEGLSGRAAAYVKAHKAGMDTQTFAAMYRKYWEIDQREGMTATRRANAWAAELQFAKEEHRITRKQYDVLRDSLTYSSSSQAEATRFDNFLEAGVSSDDAAKLAELLYTNVKGTGSYDPETKTKNVRDVDRMDTVADANWMTSAERFEALRALMEGPQIEKMETIRAEFGVNAAQYVDIYRANLDGSTKAEDIENYMKLGYTRAEAERLYRIYHPTK